MHKKTKAVLPFAIALALTACGGGGGGGGGSPSAETSSGIAVDGYLSGSTVFCDNNRNNRLDTGEMSATTNGSGYFQFGGLCSATIAVSGGVDTATGYAFKGLLKGATGHTYVTPLTSLMADTGLTPARLASALGLSATLDVGKTDPMAAGNGTLLQRTLSVQQILQQLANLFGTLTNPAAVPQLYSKAASALAGALLDSPGASLVAADGTINAALLNLAIQKLIANINADSSLPPVSLTTTDITMASTAIASQATQFLTMPERTLIDLAKILQNPLNPPVEIDTAAKNYISPKDNSFVLNGTAYTLDEFANGITINGLDTIGVAYTATGTPQIDKVVNVGVMIEETNGQRVLQVKVEQVRVVRNNTTGEVTISVTPDTQVHVFAQDAAGTSFNTTLSGLSFNPISIVNNAVTIDYARLVERTAGNSAFENSPFNAEQFATIQGTFNLKFVVTSNMNVRYEDGTPLPFTNVGIYNTIKGVEGPGITGQLTIN